MSLRRAGWITPVTLMSGTLFAIGGAEARLRRRRVLDAFVAAAGGAEARIAVVSSASSLGMEVVEVYRGVFTSLGARQVISLRPESRAQAHDPDLVEPLHTVSAIFLTGGNQLKLSSFITGTPFGDTIKEANERGTVVAGTSAGASILAEHMIAFGAGGATPKQRMSQLSAGLGLLRGVVIDQHFEQRNRYGRLLSLVAQSPSLLGLGVDEDTAAVIDDRRRLEVIGRVRSLWSMGRTWFQRLRPSARLRYWYLGQCCTCYLLGANSISPPRTFCPSRL